MRRNALLLVVMLVTLFATAGAVWAEEAPSSQQAAAQEPKKRDIAVGLIAAAAAIAVGLCAIGTGMAQSRIGAAGAGTIAEKPEMTGTIILLLAIPETMVILGFVVAIVMLFTL
jgi:V/A-type H+/Na+-transporting ATPase subunit K